MKKYFLLIIVYLGLSLSTSADNLDSLYAIWEDHEQTDSIRTEAFDHYVWNGFIFSNPDTARVLADALFEFGKKQNYSKAVSKAYNLIGITYYFQSEFAKSLDYYNRSLKIQQTNEDKKGSATTMGNIGLIHSNQGNYLKALNYYEQSLRIQEEINDQEVIARNRINIGLSLPLSK